MTSETVPPDVRFYTKPGCSLCEKVVPVLEVLAREGRIRLRKFDINEDDELQKRYGDRIPVIVVEGGPTLEGRLTPHRVRRLFER